MAKKTTEEVVNTEAGQETEKKPRRKTAAKKTATTRKKAAEKTETVEPSADAPVENAAPVKKTATRRGRKPKTEKAKVENANAEKPTVEIVKTEEPVAEPVVEEKQPQSQNVKPSQETKAHEVEEKTVTKSQAPVQKEQKERQEQKVKPIPPFNPVRIDTIVDLVNAPKGQLILNDQQIQQLSLDEAVKRFRWIEGTLAWVLNYDVVITDTNIWLELLVGHTSSHSDPKVNARLMFERQLEFISKLVRYRGGRFMMMSETYEEIDRFATQQAPTNYKDADFSDEALCRNVAARLAKRLILSQQRENRLKIEGICAESHHAAFADPAIIRKTVELFATGKRVLLITNDASVAIRSMGMCDDLQRINEIDDQTWEEVYTPLRPMVVTMDDLKVVDNYTRQYHFLQMAAGKQWMEDVPQRMEKRNVMALQLWMDGFRPGDKYSEMQKQKQEQNKKQNQNQNQQKQQEQAKKQQDSQKQKQQAQKQKQNQQKQQQQNQQKQNDAPKSDENQQKNDDAAVETKETVNEKSVEQKVQQDADMVVIQDIPNDNPAEPADSEAPVQKRQQRRRPQRRRPRPQNDNPEQ